MEPDNATPHGDASGAHAGRLIEGKYRLDERIGAGGMGTVYRATRLLIGDAVAVKVLHPALVSDQQAAERFRREAQAAARLKHPNAVGVYDFGVTNDGLVYLVMELVEGESLRELIKRQGPLTPSAASEIARQACAALEEAHRQGVVHRDVKPDNIVVAETRHGLRVKVLDFGIARMRDVTHGAGNLTQTGMMVGTPRYMSPEQCLGEEVDERSDIYSLGVVLYEMLAGTVPFNSPTPTAIAIQHATQSPPSLRAINMSVPPELEAVAMRALAKRREDRPQTAAALAEELADASKEETRVREHAGISPSAARFSSHAQVSSGTMPTVVMSSSSGQSPVPSGAVNLYNGAQTHQRANARRSFVPMLTGLALGAVIVSALFAVWIYASTGGERADKKEESNAASRSTPESVKRTPESIKSAPANVAPGAGEKRSETRDAPASAASSASAESKIVAGYALSPADVAGLSASELRRLRNAVYARHGRKFKSPDLQSYFNSRPWYSPRENFGDAELTSTDRANIALLKANEERAGKGVS